VHVHYDNGLVYLVATVIRKTKLCLDSTCGALSTPWGAWWPSPATKAGQLDDNGHLKWGNSLPCNPLPVFVALVNRVMHEVLVILWE